MRARGEPAALQTSGGQVGEAAMAHDIVQEGNTHECLHEQHDHHAEGVEVEVRVCLLSHEGTEERACSGFGLGFGSGLGYGACLFRVGVGVGVRGWVRVGVGDRVGVRVPRSVPGVVKTTMGTSPTSIEQQSRPSRPQMTLVGQSGPPQRMDDLASVIPGCERM